MIRASWRRVHETFCLSTEGGTLLAEVVASAGPLPWVWRVPRKTQAGAATLQAAQAAAETFVSKGLCWELEVRREVTA